MNIIYNKNKIKKIKRVGLIIRPDSPELKVEYKKIKKKLEQYGVKLFVDSYSASLLGCKGIKFDKMCKKSDLLIAVGGDGTLISLCRRSYKYKKPILGIYAGTLGFLTDILCDEIESFIDKIFKNDYRIDTRMVLSVKFKYKNGTTKKVYAFNDTVFLRESISGMCHIEGSMNGRVFNNYYGDGLILSTPTGSTAYNLSAGGPIVYPLTEALILTPICPHSLTQRPLVLPVDFSVELKSSDRVTITIDGQDIYKIKEMKSVEIKIAKRGLSLIHRAERNYFEVIHEKLKWGN